MAEADLIRAVELNFKVINETARHAGYEPVYSHALDPENRGHLFFESNETMPHDRKHFYEMVRREQEKLIHSANGYSDYFQRFFEARKFQLDRIHRLQDELPDYDEAVREYVNQEFIPSGEWSYDWWKKYPYAEYTQQLTIRSLDIRFNRIEERMDQHRMAKLKRLEAIKKNLKKYGLQVADQ